MHIARHSFANALYQSTGEINLVGSALGHSRETTTRGYVNSLNRDGLNTALKDLYGKM